jgi:hypothetical protein
VSTYESGDLHRLTRASINRGVVVGLVSGDKQCGCHQRPPESDRWWLCQYHIGMQDGIEALLADIEERLYAEGGFGRRDK